MPLINHKRCKRGKNITVNYASKNSMERNSGKSIYRQENIRIRFIKNINRIIQLRVLTRKKRRRVLKRKVKRISVRTLFYLMKRMCDN
jgi:hypothetical protein